MTANDMMTLRALLEKTSDADLLREMIGFTAERLMAVEVEGLTGAAHGERSPDRPSSRRRSARWRKTSSRWRWNRAIGPGRRSFPAKSSRPGKSGLDIHSLHRPPHRPPPAAPKSSLEVQAPHWGVPA